MSPTSRSTAPPPPPFGLDPSFGNGGRVTDGPLDTGFGSGGSVTEVLGGASGNEIYDVAVQPDGRIVAVGTARLSATSTLAYDFAAARLNLDGSRDAGFNGGATRLVDWIGAPDRATRVLLQPDGRIVLAGRVSNNRSDESDVAVARFNADGSPDTSFDGDGQARFDLSPNWDEAAALVVQPDGRVVLSVAWSDVGDFAFGLLRLNADGSRDAGFGTDGFVTTHLGPQDSSPQALALQTDGKLVVAGSAYDPATSTNFGLARYLADGSLDPAFGRGGIFTLDFFASADGANDVLLQSDGRIVAACLARNGSFSGAALIRLLP